jgi:hypothetical protein
VKVYANSVEKIPNGKSEFVTISLTDQAIQVTEKVGGMRHNLVAETTENNKPATVHLKIFLIFVKDDGKWKLLARQVLKQVYLSYSPHRLRSR